MWPYTSEEQSFLEPSSNASLRADKSQPSSHSAAAAGEKPVGELATRTLAMPADTNPAGDMFGGWIMAQMDAAAAITASNRANGRVVTAAVDAISFLKPVKAGDVVCCYTNVERVGLSSIYLRVQAWALRQGRGERVKVSEAGFTFVALDGRGRPRAVDQAMPEIHSDPADRVDPEPIGLVHRVYLAWVQYRKFEAALAGYRAMPEQELRARGLTRRDIVRIAYEEAERRVQQRQARRGSAGRGQEARLPSERHATA